MRDDFVLVQLLLLAGAAAAVPCPSHSAQYLVSSDDGAARTVYAWSGEQVHLVCRPAHNATCRWTRDGQQFDTGCSTSTSSSGDVRCVHGDQVYGIINIARPGSQIIRLLSGQDEYWSSDGYRPYRYNRYHRENPSRDTLFLCRESGKIVDAARLCDGVKDCPQGEDERQCSVGAACAAPTVADHSRLETPVLAEYAHNASVGYVCEAGYSFNDTVAAKSRTCVDGRWQPTRPYVCHRNWAAQRPVSGLGDAVLGLARSSVVDGDPDTWTILRPGRGQQSLRISLAAPTAPSRVLVKTTNVRFQVQLESGDTGDTLAACRCKMHESDTSSAETSRMAVCDCAAEESGGASAEPDAAVDVVIRSQLDETLVVAEVAVLEPAADDVPLCRLFDVPAHSQQTLPEEGAAATALAVGPCQPGYLPACSAPVPCDAVQFDLRCVPVDCGAPPRIARASLVAENGSAWRAVAQYACEPGYALFPTDQPTAAVCGDDGLWSFGHLSCVADSDIRVVTASLTRQYQNSVDALRLELETLRLGQLRIEQQLGLTQQQLDVTQQQLRDLLTDEVDQLIDVIESSGLGLDLQTVH